MILQIIYIIRNCTHHLRISKLLIFNAYAGIYANTRVHRDIIINTLFISTLIVLSGERDFYEKPAYLRTILHNSMNNNKLQRFAPAYNLRITCVQVRITHTL